MDIKKVIFQIYEIVPDNIRKLINGIEKKIFYVLKSQLNCANLVTREEFNNHQNFLIYTSKKIDEIENRIAFIEKYIKNSSLPKKKTEIKDK